MTLEAVSLGSMPSSRHPASARTAFQSLARSCGKNLNFFRVHLLVFTFTPLLAAAIFYACNGDTHINFIDALFVCVSAMTVTGLVTFNISTANPAQQAILFILMCFGNISAVSVTMIWIRRSFFRKKFDRVVRRSAKLRKRLHDVQEHQRRERRHNIAKLQRIVGLKSSHSATTITHTDDPHHTDSSSSAHFQLRRFDKNKHNNKNKRGPLRADMIRRIDGPAFLINSAGDPSNTIPEHSSRFQFSAHAPLLTSEPHPLGSSPLVVPCDHNNPQPSIRISLPHANANTNTPNHPTTPQPHPTPHHPPPPPTLSIPRFHTRHHPDVHSVHQDAIIHHVPIHPDALHSSHSPCLRPRFPHLHLAGRARRVSDPSQSHLRRGSDTRIAHVDGPSERFDMFPRAQTVEFAVPGEYRLHSESHDRESHDRELVDDGVDDGVESGAGLHHRNVAMRSTLTGRSYVSGRLSNARSGVPLARTHTSSKQRGFGGFPTPFEIAGMAIKKAVPGVQQRFQKSLTMPRTATFTSVRSGGGLTDAGSKPAPYLSFDATVTGNSRFHSLTQAQRDELGGVEYRALDLLAKLVPAYWLLVNLGMVTLVAPYINSRAFKKYRAVFDAQGVESPNYTWFWFFQVISAYSNTGMSLIDTSMTQMQDAYFLLMPMGVLILAGNTAFPILLRFFIWCISVCVPSSWRIYETLRFLLDHPRRCFVYLFPSSQTWFLLFVLTLFNFTDWLAFLILDIHNPVIERIQLRVRIFDGLFQSIAVRAAGFTVVSLLALAPAVQFLYVVMMYLSAFPLAMSVRSTNVYEEKSLGVYVDEQPNEPGMLPHETNNPKVWGSFLASHARRQLAFDIWWLGFALWLICIIERTDIQDANTDGWFTIFSCLFELTSAYGTVGLSLGTPYDNFSLSGRFHTLSKLVVCAVMIRGRHRGLPVAIDRAILLPTELEHEDMLDDDVSHLDDSFDHDSTFLIDPNTIAPTTLPTSSATVAERQRTNSNASCTNAAVGNNDMGSMKRTTSGVSFALNSTNTRRGSLPTGLVESVSPTEMTEVGGQYEASASTSFTMTLASSSLASHHVGGVGGLMLVGTPGQLTAIDEMENGNVSTSVCESRTESLNGLDMPSSLHIVSNVSADTSTNGSEKGKQTQLVDSSPSSSV